MIRNTSRSIAPVVLLVLGFASRADAQGGIGFLQLPTKSTITAGSSFAGFEPGSDWVTKQIDSGSGMPLIDDAQQISVTTWRDSTNATAAARGLYFTFAIEDRSQRRPDTRSLPVGDTVTILIDPNNSRSANVDIGGGANSDYRFDIVILDGLISSQGSVPFDTGLSQWDNSSLSPMPGLATLATTGNGYTLNVFVPFSAVGGAITTDFGVAFAILNDIGFVTSGGDTLFTGTWFPQNMCLDDPCDPGFVTGGGSSTGNWIHPSQWGTGFLSTVPGGIFISHAPEYVWSDGIKLSVCTAPTWASVPNSGVWADQTNLTNWYQYNTGGPCLMKIWVNVQKNTAGAENVRLLVIWGRPNIGGTQDWFVAGVSPVVPVAAPAQISFIMWKPPVQTGLNSHPCLRVYVLPEAFPAGITLATLQGISTQAQLDTVENAYNMHVYDPRTAQMNFTAVRAGTCTSPAACVASIFTKPLTWLAGLMQRPTKTTRATYVDLTGRQEPIIRQPDIPRDTKHKDQPFGDYYRVTATGVGVTPKTEPRKRYRYLQNLGGIAWAVPRDELIKQQSVTLGFELTNPPVTGRIVDKTGRRVDVIKSPARDVYVSVVVTPPKKRVFWFFGKRDLPLPKLAIEAGRRGFAAGRPERATITVSGVK